MELTEHERSVLLEVLHQAFLIHASASPDIALIIDGIYRKVEKGQIVSFDDGEFEDNE